MTAYGKGILGAPGNIGSGLPGHLIVGGLYSGGFFSGGLSSGGPGGSGSGGGTPQLQGSAIVATPV